MPVLKKMKKKAKKNVDSLEKFVEQQLQRYVELHKEHEKDLRYIG